MTLDSVQYWTACCVRLDCYKADTVPFVILFVLHWTALVKFLHSPFTYLLSLSAIIDEIYTDKRDHGNAILNA